MTLSREPLVQIVNYGVGNLGSLANAVSCVGARSTVVDNPERLSRDERILFPGVGAFGPAARALIDGGWSEPLVNAREAGTPILGICLGMQLLYAESQEAIGSTGLGWLKGSVRALRPEPGAPVPHVGWNEAEVRSEHFVAGMLGSRVDYYFAHSFAIPGDGIDALAVTSTGGQIFASIVGRENVLGVQFHPEKSQSGGLWLLRRFMEWKPC